jgi:transposase
VVSVSSVPLQQSLRNLDAAYRNFFNSRNGKRKGQKLGSPNFKKKTNQQSAEFTKAAFSMKDGEIYLAKIGDFKPISPLGQDRFVYSFSAFHFPILKIMRSRSLSNSDFIPNFVMFGSV